MHLVWLRSESSEYLDIPALSRLARRAPQHLKLRTYFCANPKEKTMIVEEIKNIKSGKSDLRNFGITMGIVLILFGGLFLWRDKDYYIYLFIIATAFIILALAVPVVLKPVHKVWMTISIILGWIMTRVILSVLFYLVVKKEVKLNKADYERQF